MKALHRWGMGALLALAAVGAVAGQATRDVQDVLDRFQKERPAGNELAIYQLDWAADLREARERAARENRPILLMVVTNSYGNLYTGHC